MKIIRLATLFAALLSGKVATVLCNGFESHGNHNIPVKFWDGVDRDTISEWKCSREKSLLSAEFVCRATN